MKIKTYDDMTEDELKIEYELRFDQRYPDTSLLLRRVLKLDAALKEARARIAELERRPTPTPPQEQPTP